MNYIFDTCAWIGAWKERYPIDRFPDLWAKFSELIESGEIHSVQMVRDEIDSPEDLVEWLKNQENLYLPPSQEEEDLASEITNSRYGKRLVTKRRPDTALCDCPRRNPRLDCCHARGRGWQWHPCSLQEARCEMRQSHWLLPRTGMGIPPAMIK